MGKYSQSHHGESLCLHFAIIFFHCLCIELDDQILLNKMLFKCIPLNERNVYLFITGVISDWLPYYVHFFQLVVQSKVIDKSFDHFKPRFKTVSIHVWPELQWNISIRSRISFSGNKCSTLPSKIIQTNFCIFSWEHEKKNGFKTLKCEALQRKSCDFL